MGAGVVGLSFAYEVAKQGKSVLILEKDNIYCLGRTGIFHYNNSDGYIEMGMELAKKLLVEQSNNVSIQHHLSSMVK